MQHEIEIARDMQILRHVVADEPEPPILMERCQVPLVTGKKVIDADDIVALLEEALAKITAEESRATANECLWHPRSILSSSLGVGHGSPRACGSVPCGPASSPAAPRVR